MLAMSLMPLQARPSHSMQRHLSCRSVLRVSRNQRSSLRAQATQQDLDSFVMIPWAAAEESWSDESAEMMESLVAKFKAADKDGNGVIDRDELRILLDTVGEGAEAVALNWLTEEELNRVVAQYDLNKDGVINFEEFVQMAQDNIFLRGQLEEYKQAFRAVDKGGNGTVGATELYHLFQRMGNPITYEKLVKVFDKYDTDDSGVIDFPEFLRMFKDELLDLQEILDYIQLSTAQAKEARAAKAAPVAPAPPPVTETPPVKPGGVTSVFSEGEFDAVVKAHPDQLTVLMASLTWCKPCKAFMKNYEKAAEHYQGPTVFLKLFGNSNDSTKALFKEKLKCRSTPTFYFFRGSKLLGQCQGANGPRLEYNLRMMLKEGEGPAGLCFPPYQPPAE